MNYSNFYGANDSSTLTLIVCNLPVTTAIGRVAVACTAARFGLEIKGTFYTMLSQHPGQ